MGEIQPHVKAQVEMGSLAGGCTGTSLRHWRPSALLPALPGQLGLAAGGVSAAAVPDRRTKRSLPLGQLFTTFCGQRHFFFKPDKSGL